MTAPTTPARPGWSTGWRCSAASGELPRHTVVLCHNTDRDQRYSASPEYARALTGELLESLRERYGIAGRPVGLGASLGALALLHADTLHPGAFSALMLQSGSYFNAVTDSHMNWYGHYERIRDAVEAIPAQRASIDTPLLFTCGVEEENLSNNRMLARRLGMTIKLMPGGHDFHAWGHGVAVHLPNVLRRAWPRPAARARALAA